MLPQFWRRLSYSLETWWSYEDLRGMKSSFTLNDSWAWYVFIFSQFFSWLAPQPVKKPQPLHPPSTGQQEQGKEQEILKGSSLDKVTEALQPGAASQDFEKQLASITLPAEGSLEEKEKETPPWSGWPGSQVQTSTQVKTLVFVLVFMIVTMIVPLSITFKDEFW